MSPKTLILLAGLIGMLGVALGAFGSHGLSSLLEANGRQNTFSTGIQYHLIHALAILGAAWLMTQTDSNLPYFAGLLFTGGVVFFSGSLYILSIFNIGIMGAIAPIGGTAFVIGWALIAVTAWNMP